MNSSTDHFSHTGVRGYNVLAAALGKTGNRYFKDSRPLSKHNEKSIWNEVGWLDHLRQYKIKINKAVSGRADKLLLRSLKYIWTNVPYNYNF